MNTEITKNTTRLPNIGEAFTVADVNHIYMRVPNEQGHRAVNKTATIYCVSLETGEIFPYEGSSVNISLLEPVGGTLKFKKL